MIVLKELYKRYTVDGKHTTVADHIDLTLPSRTSIALLGANGAGKSSLLRMIGGTMNPTTGSVEVQGSVSWPVGFAGNFHPDLTGSQNTRFIARVYGVDTDELVDFVRGFSGLGYHMELPTRTYSSGMRSRLAFGVSMGIDFDTYLVDEVTSVGDQNFRQKSSEVFKERLESRAAIVVSHSNPTLRELCTAGMILKDGQLTYYDDVNVAIHVHNQNMLAQ